MTPDEAPGAVAWVVLLVDDAAEPPALVGVLLSPSPHPIPPPECERARCVAVLVAPGDSFTQASAGARALLSVPAWRWVYRLRVLGPGFRHEWQKADADAKKGETCRKCGQARTSRGVESWRLGRDACMVSHVGRCASCGDVRPIVAGSTCCAACEMAASQ